MAAPNCASMQYCEGEGCWKTKLAPYRNWASCVVRGISLPIVVTMAIIRGIMITQWVEFGLLYENDEGEYVVWIAIWTSKCIIGTAISRLKLHCTCVLRSEFKALLGLSAKLIHVSHFHTPNTENLGIQNMKISTACKQNMVIWHHKPVHFVYKMLWFHW